jgi:hypothetical protein
MPDRGHMQVLPEGTEPTNEKGIDIIFVAEALLQ